MQIQRNIIFELFPLWIRTNGDVNDHWNLRSGQWGSPPRYARCRGDVSASMLQIRKRERVQKPMGHKSGKRKVQGRKRNPNPNFLVLISSGGVGVFHVKGWEPKSSVCPSRPRETNISGGMSQDSCRDIRGRPRSLRKKSLCSICGP